MSHNKSYKLILIVFLALIGVFICHTTRQSEVDVLKQSIPDVIQFCENNSVLLNSLIDIKKKYESERNDEHWSIDLDLDGSLRVLGLPQSKWDSVTLFNQDEKRLIETAFIASYNDISIYRFDFSGSLRVKSLGKYYIELRFFPDEKSYLKWLENVWLIPNPDEKRAQGRWPIKHSELISDGWYLFVVDGRPAFA